MTSVSFLDTTYHPRWLESQGYDPNTIGTMLSQLPTADRTAKWMRYRGNPVKQSKFFFVDPSSGDKVPVYPFTGFQYESIVREYRYIKDQPLIQGLQTLIEQRFGVKTNHVIGTVYYDHNDTVGWHQDKVEPLQVGCPIFIFSFFASRPLTFRDLATEQPIGEISMDHGSLLVLGYETNRVCQHAILPLSQPTGYRLSISFRAIQTTMTIQDIRKKARL